MSWTQDQVKQLLKLFSPHPYLYDTYRAMYYTLSDRERKYHEICKELLKIKPDVTVQQIKFKIQSLRRQFNKQRRQLEEARAKGTQLKPTLWCFNRLKFLYQKPIEDAAIEVIVISDSDEKSSANETNKSSPENKNLKGECSGEKAANTINNNGSRTKPIPTFLQVPAGWDQARDRNDHNSSTPVRDYPTEYVRNDPVCLTYGQLNIAVLARFLTEDHFIKLTKFKVYRIFQYIIESNKYLHANNLENEYFLVDITDQPIIHIDPNDEFDDLNSNCDAENIGERDINIAEILAKIDNSFATDEIPIKIMKVVRNLTSSCPSINEIDEERMGPAFSFKVNANKPKKSDCEEDLSSCEVWNERTHVYVQKHRPMPRRKRTIFSCAACKHRVLPNKKPCANIKYTSSDRFKRKKFGKRNPSADSEDNFSSISHQFFYPKTGIRLARKDFTRFCQCCSDKSKELNDSNSRDPAFIDMLHESNFDKSDVLSDPGNTRSETDSEEIRSNSIDTGPSQRSESLSSESNNSAQNKQFDLADSAKQFSDKTVDDSDKSELLPQNLRETDGLCVSSFDRASEKSPTCHSNTGSKQFNPSSNESIGNSSKVMPLVDVNTNIPVNNANIESIKSLNLIENVLNNPTLSKNIEPTNKDISDLAICGPKPATNDPAPSNSNPNFRNKCASMTNILNPTVSNISNQQRGHAYNAERIANSNHTEETVSSSAMTHSMNSQNYCVNTKLHSHVVQQSSRPGINANVPVNDDLSSTASMNNGTMSNQQMGYRPVNSSSNNVDSAAISRMNRSSTSNQKVRKLSGENINLPKNIHVPADSRGGVAMTNNQATNNQTLQTNSIPNSNIRENFIRPPNAHRSSVENNTFAGLQMVNYTAFNQHAGKTSHVNQSFLRQPTRPVDLSANTRLNQKRISHPVKPNNHIHGSHGASSSSEQNTGPASSVSGGSQHPSGGNAVAINSTRPPLNLMPPRQVFRPSQGGCSLVPTYHTGPSPNMCFRPTVPVRNMLMPAAPNTPAPVTFMHPSAPQNHNIRFIGYNQQQNAAAGYNVGYNMTINCGQSTNFTSNLNTTPNQNMRPIFHQPSNTMVPIRQPIFVSDYPNARNMRPISYQFASHRLQNVNVNQQFQIHGNQRYIVQQHGIWDGRAVQNNPYNANGRNIPRVSGSSWSPDDGQYYENIFNPTRN